MMEHEIEVKLLANSTELLSEIGDRAHLAGRPLAFLALRRQEDTYLDSDSFDLFRAGYSLRFRHRDGIVKANLKSIPDHGERELLRDRLEIEELVDGEVPVDELPRAILDVIEEVVAGIEIRPVVRIRTERRVYRVGPEDATAAMFCLDRAWVLGGEGGEPVDGFLEVEVEDSGGGRELLERAGAELMDEHGLRPSSLSKFERGLSSLELLEVARGSRP